MVGHRYVCAVHPTPYPEPPLEPKSLEKEIHPLSSLADCAGSFDPDFHAGLHGQRDHPIPPCSGVSTRLRKLVLSPDSTYALRILGIRADVSPPWPALEHHACYGRENGEKSLCTAHMGTPRRRMLDCCLWSVCLCPAGGWTLHDLAGSVCFFDFSELLILFLLDYMAIMGLFVFIGHYLAKTLTHPKTCTLR